jgi:hypothetical protein
VSEREFLRGAVTYRMIGKGTSDAPVECNCHFDEGHEPTCDIVAANNYWRAAVRPAPTEEAND